MREPLFTPMNQAARLLEVEDDPDSFQQAREAAGLHRATTLALESAFRFGMDMPVGAVALEGSDIVGRGFAGDKRLGESLLHAEAMTILDARFDVAKARPDTVVATLEPCTQCQDYLATQPGLKRVVFGLSRADAASKGLIKPHEETIFQRAERVNLPYLVAQVEDEQLKTFGLTLLDNVRRDTTTGVVTIDTVSLSVALTTLNNV